MHASLDPALKEPVANGMTLRWRFSRDFWTFFTAAFFFDAGFAVFFFLFNLYLVDLHYTERAIGSVNAAFTIGALLGTLPGGELTRRFGIRPLLLACFTAAPLLGVARTLCVGVGTQTAMAFLMGLAMSGWGVCFLPAVSRLTTSATRNSAFSLIFAVSVGTSAVGGFFCSRLPSWISAAGWQVSGVNSKRVLLLTSCTTAFLGLLALIPLHFPAAGASEEETTTAAPNMSSWRAAWRLDAFLNTFLPCMALWSGVLAVTSVFATVYLTRELGIPLSHLAIIFSCAQVLQFGASLLMPLLVRSLTRRNAITLVQLVAALALCALGVTHAMHAAIVMYLLLSVAQWMSSPVLYDMLMHNTLDHRRSTVAAMTMFGNGLAGAAATGITGVLLSRFGYRAVLPWLAVVAMSIALAFRRAHKEPGAKRLTLEPQTQRNDASFMQSKTTMVLLAVVSLGCARTAHAAGPVLPGPQLLCHRTANEDVPENTLESLEQAALLGCNVVEIDLRRTLDGEIVLNHDGLLERLTDSTGTVEDSFYRELAISDAGSWMGDRFTGLRIARLDDALRLARNLGIRLVLDIKTPGIGEPVLQILAREGILERVEFNGEWADIRKLEPKAHDAGDHTTWVRFPITAAQVTQLHREGKAVVANFSDSQQEMDLDAMKGAVAAGVDAINVDYPRLGAEAVGRPVERTIAELTEEADHGDSLDRSRAILRLAAYRGLPLEDRFLHWLQDPEPHVARAAALALLQPAYRPKVIFFASALNSPAATVRANAAWALGRLGSSDGLPLVLRLLTDGEAEVRGEAYLAVSRLHGSVPVEDLRRGLSDPSPAVRGAAALALARHPSADAATEIHAQLQHEMHAEDALYKAYTTRQAKTLSKEEIASVTASFRCQMQMVKALAQLPGSGAKAALEEQAFRAAADFSQMNGVVAAFALWDRAASDPREAIVALGSSDPGVSDRAEWMLLHAGTEALPAVRKALQNSAEATRMRAMRIVSLAGDVESLPQLRILCNGPLAEQATAAIARINLLQRR